MGAVLLQSDDLDEATHQRPRNTPGVNASSTRQSGACVSDLPHSSPTKQRRVSSVRLTHTWDRPASFGGLSESSANICTGGVHHSENCSGLETFFENTEHASHVVQRWKVELLQFHFVLEHHPAGMMWDYKMLSRYNRATDRWREEAVEDMKIEEAADLEATAGSEVAAAIPRGKDRPTDQHGGSSLGVTTLNRTKAITLTVTALRPSAASQHCRLSTLTPMA